MKHLFAIAALAITFASPVHAADEIEQRIEQRIARVEQGLLPATAAVGTSPQSMRLRERMAALNVQGVSIAVINHGAIEWARGYGMADVASAREVTPHTRFQAGSISKPLTAMAVLTLVEQGRLSLDRNVNDYLRGWKLPDNAFTASRAVTLRALLSHTAGVNVHGYQGYAAGMPLPSLLELLDGKPPANSAPVRVDALPGSAWRYSGGGFEIVQQVLEDTAHEPLAQFAEHAVLAKIGMHESRFVLPPEWEAMAAHAYLADGSPVAGGWHRYPETAAAALWTTPSDIARFAIDIQDSLAGKSNRVLSQAMTRQMLAPGIETFGLGLFLGEPGDVRPSFRHSGGNEGFRNMMFAYDTTGQGAVIMTNSDNGGALIEEVLRAIAREYGWTNYLIGVTPAPSGK